MILRLADSRNRHIAEKEKLKAGYERRINLLATKHAAALESLLGSHRESHRDILDAVKTVRKETEAVRWLSLDVEKLIKENAKTTSGLADRLTGSTDGASSREISTMQEEITKQLNQASNQLVTLVEENKRNATYAEAATGEKHKPTPITSHTIIVSSKDEKDTSDDVLRRVRGAADARASGVRVERIRKTKNQKVAISCESRDSLSRLTEKLKADAGLQINEAKNKDPLIVIKNVMAYNTDEDVLISIKKQNVDTLMGIPEDEYRVVPKYRRKARNPLECHMVLQVSPKVWQRLTSHGKVHIDLQRCFVLDQSPLVQCTRCLGFGHSRRMCKETEDRCTHCAGPHLRATCPSWTIGDLACCRNCFMAKLDRTEHSAFDMECPIRKRWDSIARSSVSYC